MKLPGKVEIVEVGPRDGFQSMEAWIDTEVKIETIMRLIKAGVAAIEAASFVSPRAIPQMCDAAKVIHGIRPYTEMDKVFALVPNEKGALLAGAAGAEKLTMVISASVAHNLSNVRKTPAESLRELRDLTMKFSPEHIKLDLATAFGCPFTGPVSNESVFFVLDGAIDIGVRDICLCDTVGLANPMLTGRLLKDVFCRYPQRDIRWSLHLHNTRGMAAANTLVALEEGIDRFESAFAGLGGCPFAPGASGNMATEDLVYMLEEMGIDTGVDLEQILDATRYFKKQTGCCTDCKINSVTVSTVSSQIERGNCNGDDAS